ncbi:MAG: cysteine--tRNA ligase [Verrucomicrobia bacterium]|jgi:cysteinyl-tRNA synthetase|nr:cysteine--tRNA ligase [Verrucomicrobiota bacterium]
MRLTLYNTLTREVEPVVPINGRKLRFYCCGPTVYGPAHIGNFRTFVMQDVFRRVLEVIGQPCMHVRNITDVDDKTIRQSVELDLPLTEVTAHWTARFHADCAALNLRSPHIEPSAVAHLPEQIALIEKLIAKGHAYRSEDGSVYFKVASFPAYGALSRLKERSITTGAVDREDSDEYERDSAADFVLWKARRPEDGPNYWPSPFGEGRPGWHVECSAMSMRHLGESFDLHSGGVDLIFPHHENEIAQSEAATGRPFVRHWFHIAHLLVHGGKMSKSLGNLYTLDDVRDQGHRPEELRYVLLSGGYRQQLNFTWESLGAARKALARLRELQKRLGGPSELVGAPKERDFAPFRPVIGALLEDLNTPEALGRLFATVKTLNQKLDAGALDPLAIKAAREGLAAVLDALGLELPAATSESVPEPVQKLAAERWQAKQQRDWATADALREQLHAAGWATKDEQSDYQLLPL